jgi:inward rectifier potassium channel
MKEPPRIRSVQEHADHAKVRGGKLRRTLFHFLLRSSWTQVLLAYVAVYLLANLLFAAGYTLTGGVANARPGSFADAFWFSVQILGTGGDSSMSAASTAAHLLVTAETMFAILLLATAGGAAFAKFSVPGARVRFSAPAVIFLFDGVPALAFRLGNQHRELVAGVELSLLASHPKVTAEGHEFWASHELKLRRSRVPALTRGFTVMHFIDAESPLHGLTPETFASGQWELEAALLGVDATSGQPVHATHTWDARDLRWGHKLADAFFPTPGGGTTMDLARFDETVPCAPAPSFPYPR